MIGKPRISLQVPMKAGSRAPQRPLCAVAAWWFLYYAVFFAASAGVFRMTACSMLHVYAHDAQTVDFDKPGESLSTQVSQIPRVPRVAVMPGNSDLNSKAMAVAGKEEQIANFQNTLVTARRALKIMQETQVFAEGEVLILKASQGTAQEIVANLQTQVDEVEVSLQRRQAEIFQLRVANEAITNPKHFGEHWGFHWAVAVAALRFFVVNFALRTLG